jgi:four helix bundle protein
MKQGNIIQEKSFAFAVRIVNLHQLFRSETSIGANIEKSIDWQSDKNFSSKLSVAYKEARETITIKTSN